ncbi:protein CDV3 homolog [Microplitis demolitor]|uniref:protein CDV3 homolog n=1 Tax=Microplitis demolitor TaxID=69319 RepID=UPI0004CDA615|nr:protein CDV3 homolog [Microplitis demolitor]
MADLDDFFAKKDRKKSKGKKFTTTDEIAKKLEETGKRMEKLKLKEKPSNIEEEDPLAPEQEDEEWREFTEERKDYTGLKLGNLQVSDKLSNGSDDERGVGDNSSDGESGEASSKQSGPWKKTDAAPVKEVVESTPAPAVQPASNNVVGMVYRSPHLRNQSTTAPQSNRSRMKNVAPDIRSEEYFPTLNAKQPQSGVDSTGVWGRRKRDEGTFEEVRNRGGTRSYGVPESQSQAPKLSLDNKYGALPQDQS